MNHQHLRIIDTDPQRRAWHHDDTITCTPEHLATALLGSGWLGPSCGITRDCCFALQRALRAGCDISGYERRLSLQIDFLDETPGLP